MPKEQEPFTINVDNAPKIEFINEEDYVVDTFWPQSNDDLNWTQGENGYYCSIPYKGDPDIEIYAKYSESIEDIYKELFKSYYFNINDAANEESWDSLPSWTKVEQGEDENPQFYPILNIVNSVPGEQIKIDPTMSTGILLYNESNALVYNSDAWAEDYGRFEQYEYNGYYITEFPMRANLQEPTVRAYLYQVDLAHKPDSPNEYNKLYKTELFNWEDATRDKVESNFDTLPRWTKIEVPKPDDGCGLPTRVWIRRPADMDYFSSERMGQSVAFYDADNNLVGLTHIPDQAEDNLPTSQEHRTEDNIVDEIYFEPSDPVCYVHAEYRRYYPYTKDKETILKYPPLWKTIDFRYTDLELKGLNNVANMPVWQHTDHNPAGEPETLWIGVQLPEDHSKFDIDVSKT